MLLENDDITKSVGNNLILFTLPKNDANLSYTAAEAILLIQFTLKTFLVVNQQPIIPVRRSFKIICLSEMTDYKIH